MTTRDFPPIHPGEIPVPECLEPMGITQFRLAKDIGVIARRINEIVHGRRPPRPLLWHGGRGLA